MPKDERGIKETIKQLTDRASSGDWKSLLKLIERSDDSEEAAVAAADLLFEGSEKIRPDASNAFAFYCIAAMRGNQHSIDVLTDNSYFDRDASYYLDLAKSGDKSRPKIENLVDIEKIFRNQGAELPSSKGKKSEGDEKTYVRRELSEEAKKWKDERDKLNAETNMWVQKRDELNKQNRELVRKAGKCKEERDELNLKVKEMKKLRDEANKKVAELNPGGRIPQRNVPSIRGLKKEMWELQQKQAYQVLRKKEEEQLVRRMKELDMMIRELESSRTVYAGSGSAELDEAIREAEEYHKKMSEYAEKAQAKHDEMENLYREADGIRAQADEAQANFIETKKKADEAHKKYINCMKNN